MALYSGLFNSVNGDRKYDQWWFALYFSTFIGNGVFPNPSNNLQVFDQNGLNTVVKAGKGWINGYFIFSDSDYVLQHAPANAILSRVDRVVLRLNYLNRQIAIEIKQGTNASSPVAPALQRDADIWELGIADVLVRAGTTELIQGNITDLRLDNKTCGIVHNMVNQVDTSTIFNQYESWFEDYSVTKAQEFLAWQNRVTKDLEDWISAQQISFQQWQYDQEVLFDTWATGRKEEFDRWFDTVKAILNTTADGNLLNRLITHEDASMPNKFLDEFDNKVYQYGFKLNQARDGLVFMFKESEFNGGRYTNPITNPIDPTRNS